MIRLSEAELVLMAECWKQHYKPRLFGGSKELEDLNDKINAVLELDLTDLNLEDDEDE